jgi:hypothetical protein
MYLQLLYHYTENSLKYFVQGILVFASVMATLGLQIILESVRSLVSDVSLSNTFHFHCSLKHYQLYFQVALE